MIRSYVKYMILGAILLAPVIVVAMNAPLTPVKITSYEVCIVSAGLAGSIVVGGLGLYYFLVGVVELVKSITPPKVPKFIKSFNRWLNRDGLK